MVSPTKVTFGGTASTDLACKVDADCYKALGGIAAATTDATKKIRCCMYYEVVRAPAGTGKAAGDTELLAMKTAYGVPTTAGEATKYCQTDYPTYIAGVNVSQPTYKNSSSGEFTADSASGDYKVQTYCDGSATALQVAAVVGAAVSISMY